MGLDSVMSYAKLRMFNSAELQVLISGAPKPIDLDDLKEHTQYSGKYRHLVTKYCYKSDKNEW